MTAGQQNVTPNSTNNAEEDEVVKTPVWLWAVVVGLGVAIVGMLALIGYKVATGDNTKKPRPVVAQSLATSGTAHTGATVPASVLPVGFKDLIIERPDGLPLSDVKLQDGYVMLRFKGNGADYLVFVNSATGKTSRITIPKAN
ncbi:MAG: hypothetical protein JKY57_00405 [Kordiimonadaceae bacterium]|nr:hypothetical protein [Kordiimonadaceae bacterium]